MRDISEIEMKKVVSIDPSMKENVDPMFKQNGKQASKERLNELKNKAKAKKDKNEQ